MTRTPILNSNAVLSAGHEGEVLEVELPGGRIYRYEGVTRAQFDDFLAAESKGRFFQQHFRALNGTRITDAKPETEAK